MASEARLRITNASTPWQRAVGLIGRTRMAEDEGMRFDDCSSIHTLFMQMPIDVVFLDAHRRVVGAHSNVRPWRPFVGCARAATVVELAAGAIARRGIALGDVLAL